MGEHVLCVKTENFIDWIKSLNAPPETKTAVIVTDITAEQWDSLDLPIEFIDRAVCEKDDGYKQLIPYVLCRHNGRFLSYQRTKSSGESRLADRQSIGLGGHINASDAPEGASLNQILRNCAARELKEELGIDYPAENFRFTGLLYSAMTDVDRKHAGIITLADFGTCPNVQPKERGLTGLEWKTLTQLHRRWRSYESWSYLLIGNFSYRPIP